MCAGVCSYVGVLEKECILLITQSTNGVCERQTVTCAVSSNFLLKKAVERSFERLKQRMKEARMGKRYNKDEG